jgi:hypothetical protein
MPFGCPPEESEEFGEPLSKGLASAVTALQAVFFASEIAWRLYGTRTR